MPRSRGALYVPKNVVSNGARGDARVARMGLSIAERVGGLLCVGLTGPELDAPTRGLLSLVRPGGIVLFRRNFGDAAQIAAFTRELGGLYEPAPILAVDQEGGRVSRLAPPFPTLPTAADLGRLELSAVARWFGALTGRGLRCLGFQMDFAPVVDLSRPDWPDGIGDRAFSDQPEATAEWAGQFLDGLAEAGVAGCLKHFPGLGGAPADTHEILPRLPLERPAIDRALEPYRILRRRAPAVMVSHGWFPALSGATAVPASLDPRVVRELLRKEVGFEGAILTDDLEMGAVVNRAPFGDVAVAAATAGHDFLLVCASPDRIAAAWESMTRAAAHGDLDPIALEASLDRIARLRAACGRHRSEPFDADEFEVVLHEMTALGDEVGRALRRRGPD